jgi:hypothetical protein
LAEQEKLAAEQEKNAAVANRELKVEKTLSQAEKNEVFELAVDISKDMKGINLHDMDLYLELYELGDDKFFYFITTAYKQVDDWSFQRRVDAQKWTRVKKLFQKNKWTDGEAVKLIFDIKKRMSEFKI